MKYKYSILALLSGVVSVSAQGVASFESEIKFPDFGFMAPPGEYVGPVFQLSDKFPKNLPALDEEVKEILKIDFKNDWERYAMAVREYVFKDNIDFHDNELSFDFKGEQSEKWFHVPWQHWGPSGREGYHGLTKEGPLAAKTLSYKQDIASNAYAVGFYNGQGGYGIGQVWKNPEAPDLSYINEKGFPEGTVVAKFLFTTLREDQVPQLTNPVEWKAYVYVSDIPGSEEALPDARASYKVSLLQMDIMVKDSRAKESNGWVFGTYAYNGNLEKKNPWENLQPVGLMWGNDPDIKLSESNGTLTKDSKTIINPKLKQTKISDDKSLPTQHLGWNSRLCGPADNPNSSCMSCHSTAQYPAVSAIMPFLNNPVIPIPEDGEEASQEWMEWFRNFYRNVAFNKNEAMTTDFSLQLSKSIKNFISYRSETEQGHYASEYWSNGKKVHKIMRGLPGK